VFEILSYNKTNEKH